MTAEIPAVWVEAAAKAIYGEQRDVGGHGDPDWVDVAPRFQDIYRNEARAALSAVYPLMVGALKAEALREAADRYPTMTRDMVSRGSVKAWLVEQATFIDGTAAIDLEGEA